MNRQRVAANGVGARTADRARSHRWLSVVDSRYAGIAILILGALFTVLATVLAMEEEEHEEELLMQSDTAPFRNAVEREVGKYASLQAVAQLTSDPLANAPGEGIRTYLLGETLQRLYPAVSFVAFVRVVAKNDLDAYERRSGVALGFDESGLPAWVKRPKQARSRYYFLENATPSPPGRFNVGTDLGENPFFARNLERAALLGSLLLVPEGDDSSRSLSGALVIASVARPTPQPVGSSLSAAPSTRELPAREPAVRQPYGFLVSGIDFNRLMTDALRDLPPGWRARLTTLSGAESAAESGVKSGVSGRAGAGDSGILVFDNNAVFTGKAADEAMSHDPIYMKPFEFEAWHTRLRLDIDGYENHEYLLLDLMPWVVFFVCVLLTAGVLAVFTRFRQARALARSLVGQARTSTERFRDIVETSSDWIWELDERLQFRYLSPTTRSLLGYAPEELLGTSALALLAGGGQGPACQLFPSQHGGASPYTGFERRLRCKDGSEIIVESTGTPILDKGGTVLGYRGTDRDVTQQRQFRERLSQLHEDQARHMQANLAGQLLSGLAHELNQPLSAISTYNQACLRLLQSGNADPKEIAAAMQATADLAMHAGAILQRLRTFTSHREPHLVPSDLASLVGNSFSLIEIRLKSFAIELHIEIPSGLPAVQVDPILATQVFLNLFNNAIDAMRDAARRRLTVRANVVTGRNVRIRVEDTGAGIAPEHMNRLFDAYFTTKPEGTGIGLPLCRSIVEAMGGSLEIHSTPGEGAVVELEFPVARADDRDNAQASAVSAVAGRA